MSRGWVTPGYLAWTAAATVSALGDGIITFALTWTATGISGSLAGALSAIGLVPTVVLLLVGGSLGDAWGQRRVLLVATLAQLAQYTALFALLHMGGPLVGLLVVNAAVAGLLQGLRTPSSGVYARQFVAPDDVRAAISTTNTLGSLTRMLNPTVGALVLAGVGLRGAALVEAVSFLGVLTVLCTVRPRCAPVPPARQPLLGAMREGVASIWRHRTARALLGSTALVAGALLPVVGLGIPLLVRHRGWPVTLAGVLEGAWMAGSITAGLLVAARYARTPSATPRGLVAGPVLAAAGILGLSLAPGTAVAICACAAMGIGTSLFTANVSPVLASIAPPELQSRWAALTSLVQFLPLILLNPLLGAAADLVGIRISLQLFAGLAVLAALVQALHGLDGGTDPHRVRGRSSGPNKTL